jgi:RNA polymerase sigma-70 factor (ECF subfamily)
MTNAAPRPGMSPAELDARYRRPLMAYFLRRTGSKAEAEDLTQEVFLRIARHLGANTLEIADGLIFTIAANLLKDRGRRGRSHMLDRHLTADEALLDEIGLADMLEPERVLMSRETLACVLRALDEVGPRTHDIFLLYRLEGMSQREIAQLFDISVSAVEKHIVKALKHLASGLR